MDPNELPAPPDGSRAERLASRRTTRRERVLITVALVLVAGLGVAVMTWDRDEVSTGAGPTTSAAGAGPRTTASAGSSSSSVADAGAGGSSTTTTAPVGFADPAGYGRPWGEVPGLLTFRGNPSRTYYGEGPVPRKVRTVWQFPDRAMCGLSSEKGETRTWCGNGWTGQPAVFERDDRTWLVFGAYDKAVHFVDAVSGQRILPDFPTGDIIKGSVTVDPDGYPLIYIGSRDNKLRIISFDGDTPRELWSLDAEAVQPTLWNNDWDGSPIIVGDYMVEGGENSQFHVVKLNRAYGPDGRVTVEPRLVFNAPGWDAELLSAIGDNEVSIENSVAMWRDIAFFANSGGLVQGWDLAPLREGTGDPVRVFRFWTGDDTDASVSIDADGYLYVGSEYERATARSQEVGQLLKLDPRNFVNPVVWSVKDTSQYKAGTWSTAGHAGEVIIWPTRPGTVYGLDRVTGATLWTVNLPGPIMGSPVIVDGVWLQGDCNGTLHAFDVTDPRRTPRELWTVPLGGCIEATPAVWKGRIYVGTRGGFVHALGAAT